LFICQRTIWDDVAAAVLGGCSLRGGEGSILGVIIGTALLKVLQNLVDLLGIPSSLNSAVMGAVIFLGGLLDQVSGQRKKKKQVLATAPTPPQWRSPHTERSG
jgi:ribose transport system permease protein